MIILLFRCVCYCLFFYSFMYYFVVYPTVFFYYYYYYFVVYLTVFSFLVFYYYFVVYPTVFIFFIFFYLLFRCVCYCHMGDPIPQVECLTFLASLAIDAYSLARLGTLRLLLKDNFLAFFGQHRLVLYQASLRIEGLGIRHVRSNSCVKHIFRPVRSRAYHLILTYYVNLYD